MKDSARHERIDHQVSSEKDLDVQLLHEVRILYDMLPMSQWVHLIGAVVLFGVLSQYIDQHTLNRWIGFFLFVICLRIIINDRYRNIVLTPRNSVFWFNLFLIGTALYGVMWSGTAIYLVPNDSSIITGITGLLLCSLAAGSVAISSVNLKVYLIYAASTLLPYSALLIASNQIPQTLYGWFIISFFIVITLIAIRVNFYFSDLIKLQQKTAFLEEEIRTENHKRMMIEKALLDNTLEEELSQLIRHHTKSSRIEKSNLDNKVEDLHKIPPGILSQYLHKLNEVIANQVNSAKELIQVLKSTHLSNEQNKYLSIVLKLLRDIDYSIKRLDLEEFQDNLVPENNLRKINIHQLLIHLTDEVPIVYKAKYITIRRHIDNDITFDLFGDSGSLKTVLRILIDNAFQNMDGGVIGINIKLEKGTEEEKIIRFEITDTGTGIPKDSFAMYLEDSDPSPGDNSGLARVKNYIRSNGGYPVGYSTLGVGTLIGFCLPFINSNLSPDSGLVYADRRANSGNGKSDTERLNGTI